MYYLVDSMRSRSTAPKSIAVLLLMGQHLKNSRIDKAFILSGDQASWAVHLSVCMSSKAASSWRSDQVLQEHFQVHSKSLFSQFTLGFHKHHIHTSHLHIYQLQQKGE